jgi:hypothetical protein
MRGFFAPPARKFSPPNPAAAAPSGALFTDNFSTGNLSKTQGGFSWTAGQYYLAYSCSNFPSPLGSTTCLRMDAGTTPGNVPELDYLLTNNGTGYTHIFFRWYVYYPSGSESPSVGPAWGRSTHVGSDNDKVVRFGGGTQWDDPFSGATLTSFRCGASTVSNADGSERIYIELAGPGSYNSPGYTGADSQVSLGNYHAGRWIKMEVEVKTPTTTPSSSLGGDGIFRIWVDGVLTNEILTSGTAPANGLINVGYLYGALNGQPDNANSYFYVTDFAFGISARV